MFVGIEAAAFTFPARTTAIVRRAILCRIMSNALPPDFDWVTARHNCSIGIVFHALQVDAGRNIDQRNALSGQSGGLFQIGLYKGNQADLWFTVLRGERVLMTFRKVLPSSVVVELPDGTRLLEGSLTVNDSGECRLKVNGLELDRWQFLKRALEDVLFQA